MSPPSRRLVAGAPFVLTALVVLGCGSGTPPPPPPVDVVVAEAIQKDVPIAQEWIGTTEGTVDAQIRAQVQGYLLSRDYREGGMVKKGDLLFRIDPRPFQAALDEARGQLGRAQAALQKSELDVARYAPLVKEGAVSQQELDNAVQGRLAGKASVDSAQAAFEKARLDLSFTEVRSPVDGVAGLAKAQIGDLVGPSTGPLTSVSQVDPIQVVFPVSEREYLRLARARSVAAVKDARPTPIELFLADGSRYEQLGTADVANREVDPTTGTILIKGSFPNPGDVLRPGLYARVRAVLDTRRGALVVPQRAISEIQGTYQVAVVGPDDKVQIRVVQLGPRYESLWVVEQGLAAGDRVIVEGIQKVRDGTAVVPKPATAEAPPAAGARDAGA